MRPPTWNPPIELSPTEQIVAKRIRKAKLFLFLRQIRHLLFDEQFQTELASRLFKDSTMGLCPVPPAQLALFIILQAYTGVSDDEALEAMVMDRRWQLVLNCLDGELAPFGKGTLVRFRAALMASGSDRRLIERTIEIVQKTKGYNERSLRVALDSSPLWGAARVEDTYNLLGHALKKALEVIAKKSHQYLGRIAQQVGAEIVANSSLKAALDLDWDDPSAREQALATILQALNQVEARIAEASHEERATTELVEKSLADARQIQQQDVEVGEDGCPKLRRGVAPNRRIAIEDDQMRHGRKSRSQRFDGYKRHVLKDLDLGIVRAVGITPANLPEACVTEALAQDIEFQQVTLEELHIDRAYLTSHWVKQRTPELKIICKSWRVRNGKYFDKTAFNLDWSNHLIRCPNGISIPFVEGKTVRFPQQECQACPLHSQCTASPKSRTISIHPDESLLQELRQRQTTSSGRQKLRERVSVEHTLAHIGQWQGKQARYLGIRKNLFDLRRMAVVHNLHILAQLFRQHQPISV